MRHDLAFQRRRVALRRARRELDRVAGTDPDPEAMAQSTSLCLRQYIGDKLGLEGGALTPSELDESLRAQGVGEVLSSETRDLLERLEAAHFGAAPLEAGGWIQQVATLVKRLEGELKR
jgi:hypothetical protein